MNTLDVRSLLIHSVAHAPRTFRKEAPMNTVVRARIDQATNGLFAGGGEIRLCCKLDDDASRSGRIRGAAQASTLARWSCSHAMASVTTHGPTPKARSTIRASPMIPPWMENIAAWPLRSARITSKPLIVA